jgi:hypothetical protein
MDDNMWEIRKGWFGRWDVYSIGHTGEEEWWIASFRHRTHADRFIEGPASWSPRMSSSSNAQTEPPHHASA